MQTATHEGEPGPAVREQAAATRARPQARGSGARAVLGLLLTGASALTQAASLAVAGVGGSNTPGVVITQTGGSTEVSEDGATDTYTVVLTSQPTSSVVV